MHERRIPLTRPTTDEDEVNEVAAVLASGHLTQGAKVTEFEAGVAALTGTAHAIATTSATTALHLSLAALGIRAGDDVLVPDYTFPATANVVVQAGARPILVDIDPMTFTMDPIDLERKITPASRAVLPVHAFGLAADMDRIGAVAKAHGLAVVEDAACALGTTYRGRAVGGLGVAGCFSFHPRKSITTGEGGMITTNDDDLAARMRLLRSHGAIRAGNRFTFHDAGYNYRLSDIHAAVGVAQLRKLERLLARRRSIADRYRELLASDSGVSTPHLPEWDGHVYQSFVVLLDPGIDRDAVIGRLAADGIETTLGTYALHREPYFRQELGSEEADAPQSADVFRRALTLPLYPDMRDEDQDWVITRVRLALGGGASADPLSDIGPPS
jgi:perosamine synthetase